MRGLLIFFSAECGLVEPSNECQAAQIHTVGFVIGALRGELSCCPKREHER
jgi:hypothetical protein